RASTSSGATAAFRLTPICGSARLARLRLFAWSIVHSVTTTATISGTTITTTISRNHSKFDIVPVTFSERKLRAIPTCAPRTIVPANGKRHRREIPTDAASNPDHRKLLANRQQHRVLEVLLHRLQERRDLSTVQRA